MTEQTLKTQLVKTIRQTIPSFVVLPLTMPSRSGVPDLVISGLKYTSWWELKYADPTFESEGIQELTMLRLNAAGAARYIVYDDSREERCTWILTPEQYRQWPEVREALCCDGFNHYWVVDHIRSLHAADL
jgi:hypothetical protein